MKVILIIAWIFFIVHYVHAQEKVSMTRNVLYAELTQGKPFYSLNFDRVLLIGEKVMYSCRFGLAITRDDLYLPVGLNLLVGKRASHLEVSFVCAPYIKNYNTSDRSNENVDMYLNIIPGIGYRYQCKKNHLFFKLGIAPALLVDIPSKDILSDMEFELHASVFFDFRCWCFKSIWR